MLKSALRKTSLITTPIYYVNSAPHIGHLHSSLLADVAARYLAFASPTQRVIFSTGTDEHGIKVQQAAEQMKVSPMEHCVTVSQKYRDVFKAFNISHSDFIRTTESRHHKTIHALWNRLVDRGFVYKGHHDGWYAVSDEMFYPESQLTDALDDHGRLYKVSAETGKKVEWIREENYIFKLSEFKKPLTEWINSNSNVILPQSRRNEVLKMLQGDLPDLSISRPRHRQRWGISVPGDDAQTVYVWLDALSNYLTVSGFPDSWSFDSADMTSHGFPPELHVIGKDILRFHAIYWPAFLMAAGLPLPETILTHAHWTIQHSKISKSTGNVIDPLKLLTEHSVDSVRYYMLRDAHLEHDGDFSEDLMRMRYSVELADQLGNLLSRCIGKSLNADKCVPTPDAGNYQQCDLHVLERLQEASSRIEKSYVEYDYARVLDAISNVMHETNQYITQKAPWKSVKLGTEESLKDAQITVYLCLESLRIIGLWMQPIIPTTAGKLLDCLGVASGDRILLNAVVTSDGRGRAGAKLPYDKFILFPKPR